jgi:hypothetical protein
VALLVAARVGKDETEASNMGSDSVWDAIRNVCDTMDNVQEDVKGALKEIPKLTGFSTDTTVKLGTLSENFHGLRNYAQDSFLAIQSKLREIENRGTTGGESTTPSFIWSFEFKRLTDRLESLEEQARVFNRENLRSTWTSPEGNAQVEELLRRMTRLESTSHGGTPMGGLDDLRSSIAGLGEEPAFRSLASGVAKLKHGSPQTDLTDRLDEMESRVSRAEAIAGDEMFELGEHVFGSFKDFGKWVLQEKVPTSGIFWDIFSVLVNMRPKGLSGKERADEQHSSERISTTMFENNLLAAMSHSRPVCLYGKGRTGALVDLEMGFGACKSYAQWISGMESVVKKMLGKQLKDFTAGVQGSLKATTGGAALSKALLAEVRAQWYKVVSWIDEFYKQLTEEANFKPEPAWKLG